MVTTASGVIDEAFILLDILVQGSSSLPSRQTNYCPQHMNQHDWEGNRGENGGAGRATAIKDIMWGRHQCNAQSALAGACWRFGGSDSFFDKESWRGIYVESQ